MDRLLDLSIVEVRHEILVNARVCQTNASWEPAGHRTTLQARTELEPMLSPVSPQRLQLVARVATRVTAAHISIYVKVVCDVRCTLVGGFREDLLASSSQIAVKRV